MKEKKTVKKASATHFVSMDTSVARQPTLMGVRSATDPKGQFKMLHENQQPIRRYSFDDNGGGYMGL